MTDNGPEFTLKDFYLTNGINHQTACVGSPQQNELLERKHQNLLNVAPALLLQSKLPNAF